MSATDVGAALPRARLQILPALTPILVAAIAAPFVGSFSTFVTLTLASLAMGMMIFTMASGLTLTFGMMDVLNFGHGAFIAIGAYVATLVLLPLTAWAQADSLPLNLAAFFAVLIGAAIVSGLVGLVFERVLIVPVYGQHLKQILITIGGSIVIEQMLYALFGPAQIPITPPTTFHGSFAFGEIALEKYRALAFAVGFVIFLCQMLVLNRTKIGLLIRAGVENREMVEAVGYRIDRLFIGVFMAGAALAGLGGALWSFYRGQVQASMGGELLVMVFIVIIIGGLGSVGGCFVASILVALIANYGGFLFPKFVMLSEVVPQLAPLWYVLSKFALISNILLMVVVLLWRPRGLYPVGGR
jgi:branched-chain amino acid transport system permease protein